MLEEFKEQLKNDFDNWNTAAGFLISIPLMVISAFVETVTKKK